MKMERSAAVKPECPNASNPFHRCAEYCPGGAPPPPAAPPQAQNGFRVGEKEEAGPKQKQKHREERRSSGSGSLPLYAFLTELPGEGRKVDPNCPNAGNPFHVCTDYCVTKMAQVQRVEAGRSPKAFFGRHSRHSSASDDSSNRNVDPRCPNASNPFHQCAEYCINKNSSGETVAIVPAAPRPERIAQHHLDNTDEVSSGLTIADQNTSRGKNKQVLVENMGRGSSGSSGASSSHTWKVDPRCPNASNPFHICAQYCFDQLNEMQQKGVAVPRKSKAAAAQVGSKVGVHPECVNASNPFHKCGEYCVKAERS